jgi:formate dehydrogenase iron-sulfur subunit
MVTKIYIPRDSSALAVGAEKVAVAVAVEAKARGLDVEIIRNGSRGLYWLETMVEVATEQGRVAYGPVKVKDVASLFDADFIHGKAHALSLGLTEEIEWLKKQQRLTFARVGITDPVSLEDYLAHDGYKGLKNALKLSGTEIVKTVTDSGLRGRGGAAFPTGIKWNTVLGCESEQKIYCMQCG